MRAGAEWKWTMAVMAAIAGTGLIPGRALALFFGQVKPLEWVGATVASMIFGVVVGAVARRSGLLAGTHSTLERGDAQPAEVLELLFAALVTAMMLARAGVVGALTVPVHNAYMLGAAVALTAALALGLWPERTMPVAGGVVYVGTMLFYLGLALDPRPVRLYARSVTELGLSGNLRATLLLALLFASINGSMARWAAPIPVGAGRPTAIAAKAGALMLAALLAGCLALRRGGDALLAQAMPWAALSARWGLAGFWLCALMEYLCATATLAASVVTLVRGLRARGRRRSVAVAMLAAAVLLFCVLAQGRLA